MSKDSIKTMQYIMDFDAPNPKVKYIVRFIGSSSINVLNVLKKLRKT